MELEAYYCERYADDGDDDVDDARLHNAGNMYVFICNINLVVKTRRLLLLIIPMYEQV